MIQHVMSCDETTCDEWHVMCHDGVSCIDSACRKQTPCVKLHTYQYFTPLQISKGRGRDMAYLHLQNCMKLHEVHHFTSLQVSRYRGRDMAHLRAQSTTCQGKKPSATHTLDPSSQGFQQPDIGFPGCTDSPAAHIGFSAA